MAGEKKHHRVTCGAVHGADPPVMYFFLNFFSILYCYSGINTLLLQSVIKLASL